MEYKVRLLDGVEPKGVQELEREYEVKKLISEAYNSIGDKRPKK